MLMFTEKEFAAFEVAGLDERMAVIRAQIQPIFQELDTYFAEQLAPELGTELFVHIAQHRRRTVYHQKILGQHLVRISAGIKCSRIFN